MSCVIGVSAATLRALTQATANHSLTHQQELQLGCGVVFLAVLALQFHAFVLYQRDQRFLFELMGRIASPALPPSEQVKCIVNSFRDEPFEQLGTHMLLPPWFEARRAEIMAMLEPIQVPENDQPVGDPVVIPVAAPAGSEPASTAPGVTPSRRTSALFIGGDRPQ